MQRLPESHPPVLTTLVRGFASFRRTIAALVVLGFIGSVLEGVGVNALVPLLSLGQAGDIASQSDPISKAIRWLSTSMGFDFGLKFLIVFIIAVFVFRAAFQFVANVIKVRICTRYERNIRKRLFADFVDSRWSYLMQQRLGHLETILLTNVRYSSLLLEHVCMVLIVLTSLVVYLGVAMSISPIMTLITLALGVVMFVVFKPLFRGTGKLSREIEGMNKRIAHFLNENIFGMKTVKVMSVAKEVVKKGTKQFDELRDKTLSISVMRMAGDSLLQPMGVIFVCILFAFTYDKPGFSLGVIAAVMYLIQRIFTYFQQFQSSYRLLAEYTPYLQAVMELDREIGSHSEIDNGTEPFQLKRALEFRGVSFAYANGQSALSDVSCVITKGETVGIVGPSGSGKTTFVDVVLRLFVPEKGQVVVDGVDASKIRMDDWRRGIGYVSQDVFLMNDTVAANIRFYDDAMTDEQVIEAARKANILDVVQSLPQGFETVIGERGTNLSVGQRQRLIIARVLARQPSVLVLDEATSALDNESERQIQKVIEALKGSVTVVIVAHRLSTVMHADRIMVLSDGRLVEQGSPAALLADQQSYFHKVSNLRT